MTRFLLILALAAVARPATTPRAGYSETIARSSEYIRQMMEANGIVGASVALVDQDEVVWEQGFGWADREKSLPVTAGTTFHFGSVSKIITTAALLILVDEGKVDLDAPVVRYLPKFRLRSAGFESITVRMLLSHQSGIPGSYFNWGFTTAPVLDMNRRLLEWLPGQDAQYRPGYSSVYTNNGFQLAEEIVAAVSGKPFYQFVRDRILEPLGMSHTGLDHADPAIAAALSKAYAEGKEQPAEFVNLVGTGGFSSTPGDLCRFLAMINGGGTAFGRTVLKAGSAAEMLRDQSVNATVRVPHSGLTPGLGWDHHADPALAYAGPAAMKDGGTMLFTSQVITLPAYRLGVAVTTNAINSAARGMAEQILMVALAERHGLMPPTPEADAPPKPAGFDLKTVAGAYGSVAFGGVLDVRTDGSALEIWARRGDSFARMYGPLTHREEGWFAADSAPDLQFGVRTLGGREVLLVRWKTAHFWSGGAVGERLAPAPALSDAWKARAGKIWVGADLDIADHSFATMVPGIRIAEREGRLVYEELSKPSPVGRPANNPLALRLAAASGVAASNSVVLEPIDDSHAWTPQQIDARDLTHLRVIVQDKQEWLQLGYLPTLWRPLESIPEPDAAKPYTASIAPERTAWVKLPAEGAEYALTAPDSVRWALYDDNLQPLFETWGGAWRLARPANSKTATLYLALYSLTAQQAVVQRFAGRTFAVGTGALRIAK